jgi:hypothetical protein
MTDALVWAIALAALLRQAVGLLCLLRYLGRARVS